MEIDNLSVEELKKGYRFDIGYNAYICNTCGEVFEVGEIFSFKGRFFEASRAVKMHVDMEHGDNLRNLLYTESKYNTLTSNQKELLTLMYSEVSDKEIAKLLGNSPSTVRHQRFMFREKAKQAKLYLAIYEKVMEKGAWTDEVIVPIYSNATMVDHRYVITEKEKQEILKTAFENLAPLRLKIFPKKEKKKVVVLTKISEQLEHGKRYTEKELNEILNEIYDDYVVIRRYLVDYGYVQRTKDCKEYWLK